MNTAVNVNDKYSAIETALQTVLFHLNEYNPCSHPVGGMFLTPQN